jgi:diguanylate cyclase (GGDEF)-like protein
VLRAAAAEPGPDGRRAMISLWIDQRPQRQQEAQLRQALAQLEQLQRTHEALRREVQDRGLRDAGSGLYSRGHFDDQLRREVDLSSREHREFALVSIALDPLPDQVRALGDMACKRVLEALGRLLRGNTRAMDASCRLDEDHFAILLSGVGLATAHSRMEGLRRQCATQIVVLDGRDLGFSVSMGVASFPHTAHTQEELMQAADLALEEAQRRGGNHVTLASIRFDPS